jgi:plasmid stabilization system protein ParE
MFDFFIMEEAQQDIEESVVWYNEKSQWAADNFLIEIDNALQKICKNPTCGINKYKNYYDFRLKKYPFTIIYYIDNEKCIIIVSAVFYHKRNPEKRYRNSDE